MTCATSVRIACAGVFLVASATFFLVTCAPASAAGGGRFASPESIQRWIQAYRSKPEPKRLPDAMKAMSRLGLFRDVEAAGLYMGFAAGVIGSNEKQAEALVKRMFPMPPPDQVAIVRAIAWSGLPEWKALMGKQVERMPARKVLIKGHLYGKLPTLLELPLDDNAAGLDALWGYYYGSGSPLPILRIVSALAWSNERNSIDRLTVGNMAKLTLAINASRDPDLMALLQQLLPGAGPAARTALAEAIEAAETFETGRIRKQALAAIEDLKRRGPESARRLSFWGQAGTTALALGCVAASALGQVQVGIPCVVGGAASTAALRLLTPQP